MPASDLRLGIGDGPREGALAGSAGTGGAAASTAAPSSSSSTTGDGLRERERSDALLRSRRVVLGGGSSSFSSVSTARSPGVSAVVTAIEIRFDGPPPLIDPPVIFEMLYVEKRFDARRSSASLCFSAASEL